MTDTPKDIPLQNGKYASYSTTNYRVIPEIDKKNPVAVHIYLAPCPVCEQPNPTYSYDGLAFAAFQVVCRNCGVFYRPVVSREHLASIHASDLVINQMNEPKPEPIKKFWKGEQDPDKW